MLQEAGAAAIVIHPRTRTQRFTGRADWTIIKNIKESVHIPVIGNGDVRVPADIPRMRAYTGCDGVMIGRAAIANPWIFAGLEREQVSSDQVRELASHALERNLSSTVPRWPAAVPQACSAVLESPAALPGGSQRYSPPPPIRGVPLALE
jgi:tRNA-dihydrouridine synthase